MTMGPGLKLMCLVALWAYKPCDAAQVPKRAPTMMHKVNSSPETHSQTPSAVSSSPMMMRKEAKRSHVVALVEKENPTLLLLQSASTGDDHHAVELPSNGKVIEINGIVSSSKSEVLAAESAVKAALVENKVNFTGSYADSGVCQWRQTKWCKNSDSSQYREPQNDKSCTASIPTGHSGWCDCNGDGSKNSGESGYTCSSSPSSCSAVCTVTTASVSSMTTPQQLMTWAGDKTVNNWCKTNQPSEGQYCVITCSASSWDPGPKVYFTSGAFDISAWSSFSAYCAAR